MIPVFIDDWGADGTSEPSRSGDQVETLVKQIEEKQGVTEQLKMQDLMK